MELLEVMSWEKIAGGINENATLREIKLYRNNKLVNREQYRQKSSFGFVEKMKNKWGDYYLIPEGGTNIFGILRMKKF